jgi:hypothetical protein
LTNQTTVEESLGRTTLLRDEEGTGLGRSGNTETEEEKGVLNSVNRERFGEIDGAQIENSVSARARRDLIGLRRIGSQGIVGAAESVVAIGESVLATASRAGIFAAGAKWILNGARSIYPRSGKVGAAIPRTAAGVSAFAFIQRFVERKGIGESLRDRRLTERGDGDTKIKVPIVRNISRNRVVKVRNFSNVEVSRVSGNFLIGRAAKTKAGGQRNTEIRGSHRSPAELLRKTARIGIQRFDACSGLVVGATTKNIPLRSAGNTRGVTEPHPLGARGEIHVAEGSSHGYREGIRLGTNKPT